MGRESKSRKGATRPSPVDRRPAVPILRFVGTFLGGFLVFQLVYYQWVVPSAAFQAYLEGISRIAAGVLRGLGMDVVASGSNLIGTFLMTIEVGCDGLQAMAILVIAVLAFPGSWKTKLWG